jgi:hypothetical protein
MIPIFYAYSHEVILQGSVISKQENGSLKEINRV